MDFKQVAIIGTDCISVSIALGLKEQEESLQIVGYDVDAVAANLARARGAFDRVERKPGRACQDADLVIVAV
ncbi:MAG: prephenate dehydrogenase/arogenate dehydrogenase family protein, partial [Anaerolineae bacterium]|nr:prephenate dehydrogenase/arogenate dehydrogenase family protein [Anaerolineae bacterium]